ncbi:MAG TPA: hypothetical protein VMS64_05855 [Candidatus Methylomirabilis sp.]|nr:hypothetical protein [Candidatus Methylomirabilis sp.]
MKVLILFFAMLPGLVGAAAAFAQVIPPIPITGPAQGAMQQLHPPTPLEQVQEQALRRSPPLPPPVSSAPSGTERWVPERQVFAPDLGRVVVVPGHYEQRINDQLYAVPALPAYEVNTGATFMIPAGERPPYDLRSGP